MKIFKIRHSIIIQHENRYYLCREYWDILLNRNDLYSYLEREVKNLIEVPFDTERLEGEALAPIGNQEVWASGVTYYSSRKARMEESKDTGGGDFYDRVYAADRPELFFKATAWRVKGPGEQVRIRRDSSWNVPEPELTLFLNAKGVIAGYSIGNDMSSRDIEGENPLYLPQAKSYDGSAAIGPCVYVPPQPLPNDTEIRLSILRGGKAVFEGETDINQIKRTFTELADYLFFETNFPRGAFLMTGTGIIPPDSFTVQSGDEIRITIPPIGTLVNTVE